MASDAADQNASKTATSPGISIAALCVQVGWAMRILYAGDFSARRKSSPGRLPDIDQLTLAETVGVYVSQIRASLAKVAKAEAWTGVLDAEVEAIMTAASNTDSVSAYELRPGGDDALSTAIRALHIAVLQQLQSGPGLAKAYSLGQSLSEFASISSDTQLGEAFAASAIVAVDRELTDLATVLPDHAAKAVAQSLTWWRDLVAVSQQGGSRTELYDALQGTRTDAPALRRTPQSNGPVISRAQAAPTLRSDLIAALPRQTERWRTILTGEKDPLDLLKPEDYLNAGRKLFGRTRDLIRKVPAPVWVAVAAVTVLFLAIASLALYLPHHSSSASGTTKFTASFTATFATVAAYLATLWKGILPRIRSMLNGLEKPLWSAALDFVCAETVSLPPVGTADSEQWSELAKLAHKAILAETADRSDPSSSNT